MTLGLLFRHSIADAEQSRSELVASQLLAADGAGALCRAIYIGGGSAPLE